MEQGRVTADATVQEPEPLSGMIELKTWADEVIRGRFISERSDEYVLDVGPPDGSNPKLRHVPRSAVMDVKRLRR